MEQLFEKYVNIQLLMQEYRNYTLKSGTFLNLENFKNKMHSAEYVAHVFVHNDPDRVDDKYVHVYILKKDSKYIKTTGFKKILNKFPDGERATLFLFTKAKLSLHINKAIKARPELTIYNYEHKHFGIELNKGPLCSRHIILTPKEVRKVCSELMAHGHTFPSISVGDPQNLWVGGKVNQVLKIISPSASAGVRVVYRIITPISGKVKQATIKSKSKSKKKPVVKPKAKKEEESDEDADIIDDADDYNDDYVDDVSGDDE